MISPLKKIRTVHHVLKEFHQFLFALEKNQRIQRIIPGAIARQNKGTSQCRLNFSYSIPTGLQYSMIKGSTAQKLVVVCHHDQIDLLKHEIDLLAKQFFET